MWLSMAYLQVDESYDAFNKLPHDAAIRQPSKRAVGEVKRLFLGKTHAACGTYSQMGALMRCRAAGKG